MHARYKYEIDTCRRLYVETRISVDLSDEGVAAGWLLGRRLTGTHSALVEYRITRVIG